MRRTFVGMERHITHLEAWQDFLAWLKTPQGAKAWQGLTRLERNYISKAEHARARGALGYARVKTILERVAPHRYQFRQTVVVVQ